MFERLYIEISNICNLKCTFCPEVERPSQIISVENFKLFATQAKPFTKQICLHLMGEPLAHPQFKDIAKVCEELGLRIFLTTNGTLLKRHEDLILNWKSLDQINFSVHSYFANKKTNSFDEYFSPILNFCDKSKELNKLYYINLRLWNLPSTDSQAKNNNTVIENINRHFNTDLTQNVDVKMNKSKKITDRIYLHFDTEFIWPSLKQEDQGNKGTCYGLRKQVAVHANGDVVPCCLDKESVLKLGNLLNPNSNLKEILSSDRAKKIRSGFENGQLVEELCRKCRFADRFKS